MNDYPKGHRNWLRERYAEGDVTANELAEIYNRLFGMNRTANSVAKQCKGISPKRWTKEQIQWLRVHRCKWDLIKLSDMFNDKFNTYRSYGAIRTKLTEIKHEVERKYGEDISCTRR